MSSLFRKKFYLAVTALAFGCTAHPYNLSEKRGDIPADGDGRHIYLVIDELELSSDPSFLQAAVEKSEVNIVTSLVHESYPSGSTNEIDQEVIISKNVGLSLDKVKGFTIALKESDIEQAMALYADRIEERDNLPHMHFALKVAIFRPRYLGNHLKTYGEYRLFIGPQGHSLLPVVSDSSSRTDIHRIALSFEKLSVRQDATPTACKIFAFATDRAWTRAELAVLK